ncbi:MAG: SDR family oxidoreductase [Actinobacteria bacterium]|nr:SDR family oxidoreductase [Actinomycetota bacterium]
MADPTGRAGRPRSDGRAVPDRALDDLVRVSRLLGADPTLVLHGGGNTSVKSTWRDVTDRDVEVLWVKGSGADLAQVTAAGFAPLRLDRLRELLPPVTLSDTDLRNELRCALLDAQAPDPSVETLVHALLPHPAVVHSHADAVLALTDTPNGPAQVVAAWGEEVVVVPYAMPGPRLVAACAVAWAGRPPAAIGLVVLQHGLFTVGATPQEAYQRHLDLVARASAVAGLPAPGTASGDPAGGNLPAGDLLAEGADSAPLPGHPGADALTDREVLALASDRARWCAAAGRPLIVTSDPGPELRDQLDVAGLAEALRRGPATPDHALFTRAFPLVLDGGLDKNNGLDEATLAAYGRAYAQFAGDTQAAGDAELVEEPDLAPRVVWQRGMGLRTAGSTRANAVRAADIARHTLAVAAAAQRLGGYTPADPEHVHDLEYWPYQRAKAARADATAGPLTGRAALVTGAASGIGRACAQALLTAGASVVGWDRSPDIATTFEHPEWLGLPVDVTDSAAMAAALRRQVLDLGGLDVLVVAAGIFPAAAHLGELDMATWRRTMAVNVDAVADLYGQVTPLITQAPGGGRVVLIASKNVPAPGPGAAAYSASKAAVTQLTRVAALEWAAHGVRVNMLHPDAVFDTGLWTPELLAARAEHYGMSIEAYKRRNLLHTEVTSARVGELAAAMAGDLFSCTTGAQIPIDGGNDRVI